MIRTHLPAVKAATFCVFLPRPELHGMPGATGTGFFVSADGWFLTAAHVVADMSKQPWTIRADIGQLSLARNYELGNPPELCFNINVEYFDPSMDIAILKANFTANSNQAWLKNRTGFPAIEISTREIEEGAPVFSYGFPLTETVILPSGLGISAVGTTYSPRVTSAVLSSRQHLHGPLKTSSDPLFYVIDKALNYGNSGGPIVATETGKVFALCSRFQPTFIVQPLLPGNTSIMVPSLYGIVASFSNRPIVEKFRDLGIPSTTN